MNRPSQPRALFALLAPVLLLAPGCFFIIEDDDDDGPVPVDQADPQPEPVNTPPIIISEDSWWACDWDPSSAEYFFEFQAVVEDDDGPRDVDWVDVTVYEAGSDRWIDGFTLLQEDGPVWGGLVWEDESNLWCGEPVDVLIEAWDSVDHYDSLLIRY